MSWFTENPMPPIVLAIVVEAILVVALAKTGRRSYLWAMLATAALAGAAVVIERLIVTPREEVVGALEEIRAIVEANDRGALLDRIDRGAVALRNRVQTDLSQLTVTEAKINDLRVLVNPDGQAAQADFIGVVHLRGGGTIVLRNNVALRFDVGRRKRPEDGRWVVTGAEYRPPVGGD